MKTLKVISKLAVVCGGVIKTLFSHFGTFGLYGLGITVKRING
jgi:hypothetical protein